VTSEKTKCLCVPHWFMKKMDKFKYWDLLKINLYNFIPNEKELFKMFENTQKKNASLK
jgi:hypothetical protein